MSNDPDDELILVCLPTKGVPKAPVPGGVKRCCCRCTRQVWLAPSGMQLQRERGATLLCILCWWQEREETGGMKLSFDDMTPAQKKEIVEMLREQANALPDVQ